MTRAPMRATTAEAALEAGPGRPERREPVDAALPSFLRDPGPRLVLFGGKGGVGKTTAAAASALTLAARHPDRKFVVLSTDPAHSLLDAFAGEPAPPNLELRELDAAAALAAWRRENGAALGEILARGTPLTPEEAGRLVGLPLPGEDEVMALLEIARLLADKTIARVLVDTAPAGHTLLLLGLPGYLDGFVSALDGLLEKHRLLARTFGRGPREDRCEELLRRLDRDARDIAAHLTREGACELVLVTSGESAVLAETRSLLAELGALGIPVRSIVANRLAPGTGCAACRSSRAAEEDLLHRFLPRRGGPAILRVERLDAEPRGLAGLRRVGDLLAGRARSAQDRTAGSDGRVELAERATTRPQEGSGASRAAADPPLGDLEPVGAQATYGLLEAKQTEPPPALRLRGDLALPDRPLLLFGGKGGVGKTTLAAAAALLLRRTHAGERVLIFSADPARTLSKVLDVPLRSGETECLPGLFAAELNVPGKLAALRRRLRRALGRRLPEPRAGAAIDPSLDREALARLIEVLPPGLAETLAVLGVARALHEGRFGRVVLDTAPTGHLLRLLEAPALARTWAETFSEVLRRAPGGRAYGRLLEAMGELARDARLLERTLRSDRASLIAVAVPTALGYEETRDLLAATRRLGLALGGIVVNRLTPARPGCPRCAGCRRAEEAWAARIAALDGEVPAAAVETAAGAPRGLPALAALGRAVFAGSLEPRAEGGAG